ncbi:hypothetical protein HKBW3S42_01309 [Candidatus Hakubella thermalkaliphila]|uniref:Uncharacterized protein n=1 Tax=Candidatus Hakubella thermalkaliphila TaxID=2754717 RepID=A0A6V8P799_9ACTN|nr:hypothetical protein HKBW3S33_01904 [Candidatus Hakubella thermalkaliphila]GFP32999.1 hypothetical protein HKBW3S42_01309 [Candidatus Hakubella thermalkaliphila]
MNGDRIQQSISYAGQFPYNTSCAPPYQVLFYSPDSLSAIGGGAQLFHVIN